MHMTLTWTPMLQLVNFHVDDIGANISLRIIVLVTRQQYSLYDMQYELPTELFVKILHELELMDLLNCRLVC